MITSLYAHGAAIIEIGQYGMGLVNALATFVATCNDIGITAYKVQKPNDDQVRVVFSCDTIKNRELLIKLIYKVAEVIDMHGDPPDTYTLKAMCEAPGQYTKTGTYND